MRPWHYYALDPRIEQLNQRKKQFFIRGPNSDEQLVGAPAFVAPEVADKIVVAESNKHVNGPSKDPFARSNARASQEKNRLNQLDLADNEKKDRVNQRATAATAVNMKKNDIMKSNVASAQGNIFIPSE